MTADTHERCTERIAEAATQRGRRRRRHGAGGRAAAAAGGRPAGRARRCSPIDAIECTNLLSPLESDADRQNPDIVKAACDIARRHDVSSRARRSRSSAARSTVPVYRQTGIMAFRDRPAAPLRPAARDAARAGGVGGHVPAARTRHADPRRRASTIAPSAWTVRKTCRPSRRCSRRTSGSARSSIARGVRHDRAAARRHRRLRLHGRDPAAERRRRIRS